MNSIFEIVNAFGNGLTDMVLATMNDNLGEPISTGSGISQDELLCRLIREFQSEAKFVQAFKEAWAMTC